MQENESENLSSEERIKQTVSSMIDEHQNKIGVYQWSKVFWFLILIVFIYFTLSKLGIIKSDLFSKGELILDGRSEIHLSLTKNKELILLLKSKNISELRLLNPKTGSAQDISLGDKNIVSAALSPSADKIAYMSEKNKKTHLFIYDLGNLSPTSDTLPSPQKDIEAPLKHIFSSQAFSFCGWGSLAWNAQSNQLAFFGCEENISQLYLARTDKQGDDSWWLLTNTSYNKETERKAIWLENDSLVYTTGSGDDAKIEVLTDTSQQSKPRSKRLYGEPPLETVR